jgi:superfamily II DNA or RNA helicase
MDFSDCEVLTMFFDENKRSALLAVYHELTPIERYLCRVLSVLYAPIPMTKFLSVLNRIGARWVPGIGKWKAGFLREVLLRLTATQIVKIIYVRKVENWYCDRLIAEIFSRESASSGEFADFFRVIDETRELLGKSRSWYGHIYDTKPYYMREVRRSLYLGDAKGLDSIFKEGGFIPSQEMDLPFYQSYDLPILVEILLNPIDEKLILSLSEKWLAYVLSEADPYILESPEDIPKFRYLFQSAVSRHPSNAKLKEIAASFLIKGGCFGEAEEALRWEEIDKDGNLLALLAMLDILKGEPDFALKHFEDGITVLKHSTKKRKVTFSSWYGAFYLILMNHAGEHFKKIEEYCDIAVEKDYGMSLMYELILTYASRGRRKISIFDDDLVQDVKNSRRPIDVFFFMLFANWIDPAKAKKYVKIAVAACKSLLAMGQAFPAADLASIIRELDPGESDSLEGIPEPNHPLKNLTERVEGWKNSLMALANVVETTRKAGPEKQKRLVWKINWESDKSGKPFSIELTPVEQTLGVRGWSAGKDIALSRLKKKPESVSYMTEQDRRALVAIKESREFWAAEYHVEPLLMLEKLAGHPMLVNWTGGDRVEIVKDEPKLVAFESKGTYALKLIPYPEEDDEGNMKSVAVVEDSINTLRVFCFDGRHKKIADIIGPKGLSVPASGADLAMKTVGGLASIVAVHSDIAGVESGYETIVADDRLYAQLTPYDQGLEIEVVTRPLGRDTPPYRPGAGGGIIFGVKDGRRVQVTRNMKAETEALAGFVSSCRVLSEAEQLSENRWKLNNAALSLELLLQLQDIEGLIVAEWPKEEAMAVRRLDRSQINISVNSSGDWFSVSGKFKVDENLVLDMKDMLSLLEMAKGRFVPIGKNSFLALTEEFRKRLEELAAFGEIKGDSLRLHPLSVAALDPLPEEVGSFAGEVWAEKRSLIDEAASMNFPPPSGFEGEMRDYQVEGYKWMMSLAHWGAGACLADDMGLGKTIQALAVMLSRAPDGPALVVAPTSVSSNWISEASRFAPALRFTELRIGDREALVASLGPMDVLVVTYGLLQNEQELLCGIKWRTIVLDEAQAIKNMGTKRSAAAMKLAGDFKIVITGTPVENNMSELWNIFRFINPGYLGSHESFARKFSVPIEREGDMRAKKRLKKLISPFVLRRSKSAVLSELPPKTEITLEVELKEEERAVYEAVRRNALEELESSEVADKRFVIFAQLVKLRRTCCNAALILKGASRVYESAKLEAFSELMEEIKSGGHKALVFSQFVDHLAILRNRLNEMGIVYQYLDGSTPPAERQLRIKKFQAGEGVCFLISLKAGGTGLNLTAADYVIHMDPWWNPAVEEQASDRTHRIGQERPVTVFRIVAKDTIEEKIVSLHEWKKDLAESLLDESSSPTRISTEELVGLLREN